MAQITVILLNWKDSSRTEECLKRLSAQNGFIEVIVVDNGSPISEFRRLKERYNWALFLHNRKNLGFSGGNNTAIAELLARQDYNKNPSEYVLFLNTDAYIDENNLRLLVQTAEADSEIGVVGPLLVTRENENIIVSAGGRDPAYYMNTYLAKHSDIHSYVRSGTYEVDYVSGTVALMPIHIFHHTGLFDEDYFFSCEMADLCQRVKEKGYKCVVNAEAKAWHESAGSETMRNTLYTYYIFRNRFLFIHKFKGRMKNLYRLMWIARGIVLTAKKMAWGEARAARAIWLALCDGLAGRFGGRNDLFLENEQ